MIVRVEVLDEVLSELDEDIVELVVEIMSVELELLGLEEELLGASVEVDVDEVLSELVLLGSEVGPDELL